MDHGYLKDGTRHGGQIRAAPIGTGGGSEQQRRGREARSEIRDGGEGLQQNRGRVQFWQKKRRAFEFSDPWRYGRG
jgi:hypothetical protein